jgi:hypothetical protein
VGADYSAPFFYGVLMNTLSEILGVLAGDWTGGILTDMKVVIAASIGILLLTYGCFIIMRVMGIKTDESTIKDKDEDDD